MVEIIEGPIRCMLCGRAVAKDESMDLIHRRERRDTYLDFDWYLLCKQCGETELSPLRERIKRRYTKNA